MFFFLLLHLNLDEWLALTQCRTKEGGVVDSVIHMKLDMEQSRDDFFLWYSTKNKTSALTRLGELGNEIGRLTPSQSNV